MTAKELALHLEEKLGIKHIKIAGCTDKKGKYIITIVEIINAIWQQYPKADIQSMIRQIATVPDTPFDDDISIVVIACNESPIYLPEDATWLCKCGCRNPLFATYCIVVLSSQENNASPLILLIILSMVFLNHSQL